MTLLPGQEDEPGYSFEEDWNMFPEVQQIVRSSTTLQNGLDRTIAYARSRPDRYDRAFWDRVEVWLPDAPYRRVMDWVQEGLENIDYVSDSICEHALLDLGDCPKIFDFYCPNGQEYLKEEFYNQIQAPGIIDIAIYEDHFKSSADPDRVRQFGWQPQEWAYHHVRELTDPILSWDANSLLAGEKDYCLLWLAFGSLALAEPLRDPDLCRRILRGRRCLFLLSGFESLFYLLGVVTNEGLLFCNSGDFGLKLEGIMKSRTKTDQLSLWSSDYESYRGCMTNER
jgi:hypothetical protein